MKKTILTFLTVLLTASAFASAELVKERAKQQRDVNNQQQGAAPAPGYVAPSPRAITVPGAPSAPPGVSAAQQSLIDRLQADCAIIKLGSETTADQKQRLQQDLTLLAKGSNKPSTASCAKLAGHLATALAEKQIPSNDLAKLSKDINIIANSAALTPVQAQSFINDAQSILKRAGVSAATVQLLGNDLGGMANEIQKSKPKLYQ